MDSEIVLAPKYNGKRGPEVKITAFKEGFYEGNAGLIYKNKTFSAQSVSFKLPKGAFDTNPSAAVIEGVFKLENDLITVTADQPPRADFTKWIGKLFENKLKTEGYYAIRDIMARILAITNEERLWYMSGINAATPKRADVMPGMTIRIESAQYMPQTSPTADDLAGYTPQSGIDYNVGLNGGFLTVNPFLNKAMGYFAFPLKPGARPTFITGGGGIDFFNINMKYPYWVLQYPNQFPESGDLSSMYTNSNTTLFAVTKPTDALNNTQYHMVFRARSTVSLMLTVHVNNSPRFVPVGSTVEDLLSFLGCYGRKPKLYRNTGLGGKAEMFWFGEETYLLNGDCIEV
jgi:hypothetical protein